MKLFSSVILGFFVWSDFTLAATKGRKDTYAQIAVEYRNAINADDVATLTSLSNIPMTIINQDWDTAKDGYGFVLGNRKVSTFQTRKGVERHFKILVKSMSIEGKSATFIPVDQYSRYSDIISVRGKRWKGLKVFQFLRGEEDVEHIVLIAIDPITSKVSLIYAN